MVCREGRLVKCAELRHTFGPRCSGASPHQILPLPGSDIANQCQVMQKTTLEALIMQRICSAALLAVFAIT